MQRSILSEVDEVINGHLLPGFRLVSCAIAALFIIAVLVLVNPVVAVSVMFVLGGIYTGVYLHVSKYLQRIGRDRVGTNRQRYLISHEVMTGIKEVKVSGLEAAYLQRFRTVAHQFAPGVHHQVCIGIIDDPVPGQV